MVYLLKKIKLWTKEEDLMLRDLTEGFGGRNWKKISSSLKIFYNITRTPKQCSERWKNYLNGSLKRSEFSHMEIEKMLSLHMEYGNKWSKIANFLPGRSSNQIKNYFHSTIRRNLRKFNFGRSASEKLNYSSFKLLENKEIRNILLAGKDVKKHFFMKIKLSDEAYEYYRKISQNSDYFICKSRDDYIDNYDINLAKKERENYELYIQNNIKEELNENLYEELKFPEFIPQTEFEFFKSN
ncbi:hypothetical protein SteCoe_27223 [Stentor coeruleus]|uniref:Uncharacterized protein n=1 Tax=Stentor coeruleus TaxID=5963 RepID=A0A1R2BBC7_9CILI|nr:hypothetical protein SteCoe_27223 [Stentor coeruleus]